jgi:hypothetical protein
MKFWARWKRFGQWMGDNVARLLLIIFYFTIALPFGVLVRLTQDPLDRKGSAHWVSRHPSSRELNDAKRSF